MRVWLSCSVSRNEWSKWPLCLTTLLISRKFILLTAAWHTCISRNWRPPILISRLILNNFIEWLLAQLGESHRTCLVSVFLVKVSSLVLSLFWFVFVFSLCFVRLRYYKLTGSSAHGWFFIMKDVIMSVNFVYVFICHQRQQYFWSYELQIDLIAQEALLRTNICAVCRARKVYNLI